MAPGADARPDREIIREVIAGDVNAFEVLVTRYEAHVFSILRRHVPAEDVAAVAHDVFVRAFRSLGGFKEKSPFKHWLAALAVRTGYDFWRDRYRCREIPESSLTESGRQWIENAWADEQSSRFDAAERQAEARQVLDWALNGLTAEERMVIVLVHIEGFSGSEAAELLGWSVANVKIKAHRARKKLRKILAAQQVPSQTAQASGENR